MIYSNFKYSYTLLMCVLLFNVSCNNQHYTNEEENIIEIIGENTLEVMTYNIRGDQPEDGENQWKYRKDRVANLIRKYSPALLGLQEAKPLQLAYLEEQLVDYKTIGGGSRAGEYTVILYNTKMVEFVEGSEDFIWLSETPEEQSVGWDAKFVRILIYATFRDPDIGDQFLVLNTHFDHVGEQARYESAKLVVSTIQDLTSDEPVVLMGDFNFTEDAKPYEIIIGSGLNLRNAFYASVTPHEGPTTRASGFSVENHSDKKPIDFIFINNKVKVLTHAFLTESTDGYYPSDHLPVLAQIEFN